MKEGRKAKIRLYFEGKLKEGEEFLLGEKQTHYLFNVMKLEAEDFVLCFDNKNGEFLCEIAEISKKKTVVKCIEKTRKFELVSDIWLLFAPVKKDNTDFIIEKATELGVRKIVPVITERTNSFKVKKERFVLQSIEAAEQSRRIDLPEIEDAVELKKMLAKWNEGRVLFFCNEKSDENEIAKVFSNKSFCNKPCAILIGPEGGFSDEEIALLKGKKFVTNISLGKRILRAETAVVAALSCWQAILGDWK